MSYRDREDVKTLFRMGRHSREREDWKKAAEGRGQWQRSQLHQAAQGS